MAKEFQDWDRHFAQAQIESCRAQWRSNIQRLSQRELGICQGIGFWIYHNNYRVYDRAVVADAVYTSADPAEWQKFRVSMKGLSTHEKLAWLEARWDIYVKDDAMGTRDVEKVRINNYIGALRRGGQLDSDFNVRK